MSQRRALSPYGSVAGRDGVGGGELAGRRERRSPVCVDVDLDLIDEAEALAEALGVFLHHRFQVLGTHEEGRTKGGEEKRG